ncbi:MAG: zinc ribbon domain-containing protein, partial [Lachnospiraceae bacterium]|nr:zinc ribbon domain-containing protein [Lachnospiraceae bacterium]
MKRCMYCGHENDDASENCSKCGNHLIDTPTQQDIPVEDVPDELFPEQGPEGDLPFVQQPEVQPGDIHIDEEGNPRPAVTDDIAEDPYYGSAGMTYGQNAQYGGQMYGYDQSGQQYDNYTGESYAGGSAGGRDTSDSGSLTLMKKARKRMHNPILFLAIVLYTVHFGASILNIALGNAITNISTVSHTITKMTGQ